MAGKVHSGKNSGFSMKHGYFHETNAFGKKYNAAPKMNVTS